MNLKCTLSTIGTVAKTARIAATGETVRISVNTLRNNKDMKKFRIVKETPSGCDKKARYYVQKRYRFLFISYWDYIRDSGVGFGDAVYFWDVEEAKKFIEDYREGESKVVYEE